MSRRPAAVSKPKALSVTFSTVWLPATVDTPRSRRRLSYPAEKRLPLSHVCKACTGTLQGLSGEWIRTMIPSSHNAFSSQWQGRLSGLVVSGRLACKDDGKSIIMACMEHGPSAYKRSCTQLFVITLGNWKYLVN